MATTISKKQIQPKAPPKSTKAKSGREKKNKTKKTTQQNPAVEKPASYSVSLSRQSYFSTLITPPGNGWYLAFNYGKAFGKSYILPTLALGGSTSDTQVKRLPSGTENLAGTSIPSTSWMAYLGFSHLDYQPLSVGNFVTSTTAQLGFGNYSINNISWQLMAVRKETNWGISFNSGQFSIQPYFGLTLESTLALDKPENQSTLPDYSRLMAANLGVSFAYRDMSSQTTATTPTHLQWINHVYADLMNDFITPLVNYKSVGRDIAETNTATENAIGAQEASTTPSASSDIPTLLLSSHFFSGSGAGKMRLKFKEMKEEWQDNLLFYHLGRTAAFSVITAASERPDVLAPAAFSSVRNLIDLWALRRSTSAKEAMLYHLAIGSGMMALGALANHSPYGKALSQAGMEGISATALSPDALDSKKWIEKTRYEYFPISTYSRSGGVGSLDNESRPSVRIQTTFLDTPLYLASTASTPMGDIRSIGGRTASFVTSSEGTVKYANTDIDIPSAMANTLGLQGSMVIRGSGVSVHGNIGAGPHLEWNSAGIEPGLMGEIGAGIDIHPSDSWSFGVSARCSATKFIDGHATDCGIGLGLSFDEKK